MRRLSCMAILAVLSSVTFAQHWSDNFDSYANGSQLHGVNGWVGWDNTLAAGALVSNAQSNSPSNSVDITGGADLVQTFSGATDGAWLFETKVYVPTAFTGSSYFIMLNTYNHTGPYDWSVQIHFDAATNTVTDDYGSAGAVAFTRGVWHDLTIEIDLDNDTKVSKLNGTILGTAAWKTGANSLANIGAIDLFANGASSVYYDDMRLVPEPASMTVLALGALAMLRRRRA